IEAACQCGRATGYAGDLFMTWEDVVTMRRAGMDIGSHTRSHKILSQLGEKEQKEELTASKAIIEEKLGEPIHALAYPEGGRKSFTDRTCELAEECGYRLAFTFISGFNQQP